MAVANCADAHTAEAVAMAWKEGIVDPFLVGGVEETAGLIGQFASGFPRDHLIAASTPEEICFKATSLVREGRAKFLMKGLVETAVLLRAILNAETGIRTDRRLTHLALHSFSNGVYHKLLGVTDSAIIVNQGIEEKKDILKNAVDAMQSLGYDCPKVAALCAIEKVNPKMPETVEADQLAALVKSGEISGCEFIGPIPFDVAFSAEAAQIKHIGSSVPGDVDVMITPSLAAGNILSKVIRALADTSTVGMILGARAPVILLSRSANVASKYTSIVVLSEMV